MRVDGASGQKSFVKILVGALTMFVLVVVVVLVEQTNIINAYKFNEHVLESYL